MSDRKDIDFAKLAGDLLSDITSLVPAWLPSGRFERREYVALNPTRADKSLGSFRINMDTGKWSDFATGDKGGDLIALRAYIDGSSQIDAAKKLNDGLDIAPAASRQPAPRTAAKPKLQQTFPAPPLDGVPDHPVYARQPDGIWTYHTADAELIGFVCRYNTPTEDKPNHKDFAPYLFFGAAGWRWSGFSDPRPLYGLETLEPGKPVIVVEGEKTANAGRTMYPNHAVVTWPGGNESLGKVDWKPLHGRDVILWPDNDPPGIKAMEAIRALLEPHAKSVRVITPPESCPPKWDLADARWSQEEACRFLEPAVAEVDPDHASDEPQHETDPVAPFVCLGHASGRYYYHAHGTQMLVDLTSAQHTKSNLMALAPLTYWEREFQGTGKGARIDWDYAANWLFRMSERVGIFDKNRIRGRGAWFDQGRIVLNLGNKVLVGDECYIPASTPSEYIYEAGPTVKADLSNPLTTAQAHRYYTLVSMMPWDREVYGRLAAGWTVCALIGGALDWRPHLWITGRKGTGKTTLVNKIIGFMLGSNCLPCISESTAPGIRQVLGSDSIPVTFDEAEGTDAHAVANLQNVLALARQSSSESMAKILKGGANGDPAKYHVRSCFLFSSISSSLVQESDKSRVTLLELTREKARFSYEDEILPLMADLLTDEYRERFYARAIKLAPIIRKNARVFASAVAKVLGEQRAGDQYGALLAGAWSLHNSKVITKDQAEVWVAEQNWQTEQEAVSTMTDEYKCLNHIMGSRTKFRASTTGPVDDVPIGELVDAASGKGCSIDMPQDRSAATLVRLGIKVTDTHIWIANDYLDIKRLLEGTPWQVDYKSVLKRLPGADSPGKIRFTGIRSSIRCTRIPLDVVE